MVKKFFLSESRGSVLVMVLWVLSLLTMIVAYYSSQVKILRNAVQFTFESTKEQEAALSVLRLVAKNLKEAWPDDTEDSTPAPGEGVAIYPNKNYTTIIGGMKVKFIVENEAGKIDLNRVGEDFLRDFMRYLIGDEDPVKADTITDSILDWRDPDRLNRVNGAEDNVYEEKDPPYHAANGPFKTVYELRLVNGVTDRLFFGPIEGPNVPEEWKGGLIDLFTLYSGESKSNPDYAPLPIKDYMEQASVEGSSARSKTWLLKVEVGNRAFDLYFEREGAGSGYKLVYLSQGVQRRPGGKR